MRQGTHFGGSNEASTQSRASDPLASEGSPRVREEGRGVVSSEGVCFLLKQGREGNAGRRSWIC